tara:strand:+ start:14544 stop:15314 length:771 start_codon:yes stop_codon:yes gene_type:complete
MEMICINDPSANWNPASGIDDPILRWRLWHENTVIPENSIFIDEDKVEYCFDIYQKALKHCDDVIFAYDHDAILYRLDSATNIDLINIDYHDDVFNGTPLSNHIGTLFDDNEDSCRYEASLLAAGDTGILMEGNWVAWLDQRKKLNSYTWIHGSNQKYEGPGSLNVYHTWGLVSFDDSKYHLKEDYEFDNYEFDFIFVCLSPLYIPRRFWNPLFTNYLSEYQEVKGKPYKMINRKYEIDYKYNILNKLTLPPRLSN